MDALFNILYSFAMEHRMTAHLSDPEYCQAKQRQTRHYDTLDKLLDAQGRQTLMLYDEAGNEVAALDGIAAFRAGLRLGLELSRL